METASQGVGGVRPRTLQCFGLAVTNDRYAPERDVCRVLVPGASSVETKLTPGCLKLSASEDTYRIRVDQLYVRGVGGFETSRP